MDSWRLADRFGVSGSAQGLVCRSQRALETLWKILELWVHPSWTLVGSNNPWINWGVSPTCPALGQPGRIILAGVNLILGMARMAITRVNGRQSTKMELNRDQSLNGTFSGMTSSRSTILITAGLLISPPNQLQEERDDVKILTNGSNMVSRQVQPLLAVLGSHGQPHQGTLDKTRLVWMAGSGSGWSNLGITARIWAKESQTMVFLVSRSSLMIIGSFVQPEQGSRIDIILVWSSGSVSGWSFLSLNAQNPAQIGQMTAVLAVCWECRLRHRRPAHRRPNWLPWLGGSSVLRHRRSHGDTVHTETVHTVHTISVAIYGRPVGRIGCPGWVGVPFCGTLIQRPRVPFAAPSVLQYIRI